MVEDNNEEILFPQDEDDAQDMPEEIESGAEEDVNPQETISETAVEEDDPVAEMEQKYMALYAEYENFRKRTAREKEKLYQDAVADVTGQWLTLLDNITRAVDSTKNADENSVESVVAGIELLQKQADDVLAKIGVTVIEADRGTKFDPKLHEAVMHVEDGELGEQEIAQVFQKGYIYKEQVIRHSVVQVAN
ncbi:MAG: nucleotide exchange factor GrpE [Clostridiales bacterium]|nr:nucleotide exchange factor GrpE [Clostridiales bacterium]